MKPIAILILILTLAVPCAAEDPRLHIIAGQSNCGGLGDPETLSPGLCTLPDNVELWAKRDNGPIVQVTEYTDLTYYGPEVMYLFIVASQEPERHHIAVKFSRGNSGLPAWSPTWTCSEADTTNDCAKGSLYQDLQEVVATALHGRAAALSSILWVQGEKDGYFEAPSASYRRNLNELIQAIRTRYGNPSCPVILAVTNPPVGDWSSRVSQSQIDSGRTLTNYFPVTMQGLPKREDGIHLTGVGALLWGERAGRKWTAYLNSETRK